MSPKKTKQQALNQENIYVVLRSNKTSQYHVVPGDQLSYAKKDGLKIGTFATFHGGDDPLNRCRGPIVMSGTKQQCENHVSSIKKTNNNNKPPVEFKSDSSNQLIVDDTIEECDDDTIEERDDDTIEEHDDDNNNNDELEDESEISTYAPTSQQPVDAAGTSDKSETLSITNSANNSSSSSSSSIPTTTVSSCNTVLKEINNNIDLIRKRKEVPEEATSIKNKKQRTNKISHSEQEKLKREVSRLQREITLFKTNWMPRPVGPTVNYFIEVAKILSGQSIDNTSERDKEDQLKLILTTLCISEADLRSCISDIDIKKTCRQITRFIYRDLEERAAMLISLMNKKQLKAIQDYARLVHPAQSKTSNSILNGAIGNVFSTEKRRQEKRESDDDIIEDSDEYDTQE